MAEDLIARYQLDISDLKLKVNQLETEYKKLTDAQKQSEKAGTDSAKKVADETDKATKKTQEQSEVTKAFGNQLDALGKRIATAFAVEAIVSFGVNAIKAFGEAERNALKLQTAVGVNGGVGQDFDRLIAQSSELQKKSIFDDDAIQQVQTAALQFGLTADEVEKLTPTLIDFASATGQDLNSALSVVISGVNGATRGLKQYGINVDENASAQDRYNAILEQANQKFAGQGEIIAGTTLGATAKLSNAWGDLTESIGEFLATKTNLTEYLGIITQIIQNGFNVSDARIKRATEENAGLAGESIKRTEAGFKKLIDEAGKDSGKVTEQALASLDKSIAKAQTESARLQQIKNKQSGEESFQTEQAIGLQNALIAGYTNLKGNLVDYNRKRTEGEINYAKLSTEKLKELSNQNNIFATKELDRRKEAGRKASEAGKKEVEERKKNLEELQQLIDDANKKRLEADAKTEVEKLKIQKESALKQAQELFQQAGGEKNLEAVKLLNQARLAIENQYNDLIREAKLKSIQDTFNQQLKLNEDNAKDDLQNTLNNIDANANAEILAKKQAVLAKGEFTKEAEKKLQDDILKITQDAEKKKLEESYKFEKTKIENARNLAVQNAIQEVSIKTGLNGLQLLQSQELNNKLAGINANYNDKKSANDKLYADGLNKLGIKILDGQLKFTEEDGDNWTKRNEAKIQAVQQLAGEVLNFYNKILDAQIKSKEEELTNLQESFDTENEQLQLQYEKRLIGAGDFEKEQNRIKQQRIDSEKKIQAEIIKLKRQEDIANKAKAIFDIGINTAVQISKVLANPFLVALIATLGAVQVASVLATPLPKYAKGTKYLKRGNNPSGVDTIPIMADEGERIIPRKNNLKYWDIYNALDENKWNEFVQAKYIYPALNNQIKEFKKAENKTFAENISNSFELNHDLLAQKIGAEIEWRNRKGIKVQGMNELIEVMDKQIDFRKI